jgi:hypothetical protein
VGHILANCKFSFQKKFQGNALQALEERIASPIDNHGVGVPVLESTYSSDGGRGNNEHPSGPTKLGEKHDLCVGDIPIQVNGGTPGRVEGNTQTNIFGDDLDLSAFEWRKLEALWTNNRMSSQAMGKNLISLNPTLPSSPSPLGNYLHLRRVDPSPHTPNGVVSFSASPLGRAEGLVVVDLNKDSDSSICHAQAPIRPSLQVLSQYRLVRNHVSLKI